MSPSLNPNLARHDDLTQLYGPAVRCKPNVKKWRGLVLRICIRPLRGAFVLLAIMDSHDVRKLLAEEAKPLTYRNAMLQEKAADLIDHSRSLADQARSHPVQRL